MVITIIGGGNIGTLMAGQFAAKGHDVRIVASDAPRWSDAIDVLDPDGSVISTSRPSLVTNDLGEAMAGTDMVWVTYPTYLLASAAEMLLPFARRGLQIGIAPGNDAEFFFAEHVRKGAVLFGLQRVHNIARLKERGRAVYLLGSRPQLHVAALPSSQTALLAEETQRLFEIPTVALSHYLVETLTPSNPILHPTRIRTMFADWEPGVYYDRNILFYEEWDIASSELMLACDDELQSTCRALERELGIDLAQVISLREYYESPDPQALTRKISSIPAFKGMSSPMKEIEAGRWAPDFDSRYFKADFAYGLKTIVDLAKLVNTPTPNMVETYEWYMQITGDSKSFDGVPATLQDLAAIYS